MVNAIGLVIAEFVALAFICWFVLRYFRSPTVTWDVTCTVYLGWILGFATVLILPYDLSYTLQYNSRNLTLSRMWSFVYWSTFILAWLVLPIQVEYHSSGHFTRVEKLRDAIRKFFYTGLIAIVLGVVYLVYMLSSAANGSFAQVIAFTMALSNTYGILLITVLLGSGLISLPKRLWEMADSSAELIRLFLSAANIEDAFLDARYELEDVEAEVMRAVQLMERGGISPSLVAFVEVIREKQQSFDFDHRSTTRRFLPPIDSPVKDLNSKSELVSLHVRLQCKQDKAMAAYRRWSLLLEQCRQQLELQQQQPQQDTTITASSSSSSYNNSNSSSSSWLNWGPSQSLLSCLLFLHLLWIQKLRTVTLRFLSIFSLLLSGLLLVCELLLPTSLQSPLGIMIGVYSNNKGDGSMIWVQSFSFVLLVYLSLCTYWPLFRLNLGGFYRLQGPQLSPAASLLVNAEYLARLQFALGYNFLLCLGQSTAAGSESDNSNDNSKSSTGFGAMMSHMQLIPVFGTSFQVYLPLIMLLFAGVAAFDGMARLLKALGVDSEEAIVYRTVGSSLLSLCRRCRRGGGHGAAGNNGNGGEGDAELLDRINHGRAVVMAELKRSSSSNYNNKSSSRLPVITPTIASSSSSSNRKQQQPFGISESISSLLPSIVGNGKQTGAYTSLTNSSTSNITSGDLELGKGVRRSSLGSGGNSHRIDDDDNNDDHSPVGYSNSPSLDINGSFGSLYFTPSSSSASSAAAPYNKRSSSAATAATAAATAAATTAATAATTNPLHNTSYGQQELRNNKTVINNNSSSVGKKKKDMFSLLDHAEEEDNGNSPTGRYG